MTSVEVKSSSPPLLESDGVLTLSPSESDGSPLSTLLFMGSLSKLLTVEDIDDGPDDDEDSGIHDEVVELTVGT